MTGPTLSDLFAVKTTVTVGGRAVALRPPTLDEQLAFSAWVKDRARRELAAIHPQTPDDAADRMTRLVMRDIAGGYYEPDAPGYVEAVQRPDGMAHLLYLTLRADHPDVTPADVRKLVEDGLAEAFLRVLQAEGADPKVLAQAARCLGFPESWLSPSGPSSSASATPPSTGSPGRSGG